MEIKIDAQNLGRTVDRIARIQAGIDGGAIKRLQQKMGMLALRNLVLATPKGWTGHTRQSWTRTQRFGKGVIVTNESKVMLFLEEGTQAHGPVTAKALFIPKTRRAAISGWNEEMVFGVDYILAKHVKGIKAMRIVAKERVAIQAQYRKEAEALLRRLILSN